MCGFESHWKNLSYVVLVKQPLVGLDVGVMRLLRNPEVLVDRLKIVIVRNGKTARYEVREWVDGRYVTVYVGVSLRAANNYCQSLKDWLFVETSV